jgi:hypothetical protein
MKTQEHDFLLAIRNKGKHESIRDIVARFVKNGMPRKRLLFWLDKWADMGWYEYGVSPELGWLTSKGLSGG